MNNAPAVDRRVTRTHNLLGKALITLALEKGYDQVTIQDITDKADIGYRTFFRHFDSKDALLLSVVQDVLAELEGLLGLIEADPRELLPEDAGKKGQILFQYVQEHENIFRVLLLERGSRHFLKPIIEHGRQKAQRTLFFPKNSSPLPLDMLVNHMVTSTLSLVRWWLENDMPYSPDEMGQHLLHIVALPTRSNLLKLMGDQPVP
jgi:AcrR family transcriptional regulator